MILRTKLTECECWNDLQNYTAAVHDVSNSEYMLHFLAQYPYGLCRPNIMQMQMQISSLINLINLFFLRHSYNFFELYSVGLIFFSFYSFQASEVITSCFPSGGKQNFSKGNLVSLAKCVIHKYTHVRLYYSGFYC